MQVIAAAREMHRRGLVTGTVGNVSARFQDGMLITPTRRDYARLRARDIVEMHLTAQAGRAHPSREWQLHAALYRSREDIAAIVHTHSPFALARSFDPAPIVVQTEERAYLDLDQIPVTRPQPVASAALAQEVVITLAARPAALLARHGVIAVGDTPRQALEMAAAVECQAQIDWLLRMARQQSTPRSRGRRADILEDATLTALSGRQR